MKMSKNVSFFIMIIVAILLIVASSVSAAPISKTQPGNSKVKELRKVFSKINNPAQSTNAGQHASRPPRSRNLSLLGANNFDGTGFNADVWALGKFAYVGTWGIFTESGDLCPNLGTKVVDISDPSQPSWVNTLPAPPGTQTNDVKVATVSTKFFNGDLAVVSNEDCAPGGARGFELWDVTDPASAEFLGRFGPEEAFDTPPFLVDLGFGVHNTFIFEQGSRVYVAAVIDFAEIFQLIFGAPEFVGDLRIVDVTDPRNPVQVGDWGIVKNLGLDPFEGQGDFALSFLHDVWVERDIAYLSYWDAGLILLDISDPADPQFISQTKYDPGEDGDTHVAVPARGGNLIVTGDEDFSPDPWGFMRVFNAQDESNPFQIGTFATENALNAPPPIGDYSIHNVITRGNTVYASWYSDGIRVIDISRPGAPRELASFVPAGVPDPFGILPTAPEMWGIYVQGQLVFGSDMNAGLYILKHVP